MKQFEIGKEYSMRSICDHNCRWTYEVIARTAKMVTLRDVDNGSIKKCRILADISKWAQAESVKPLGSYSMAPTLRAEEV